MAGTGPDAVPGHSSGGLAAQIHKANLGGSSGASAGASAGGGKVQQNARWVTDPLTIYDPVPDYDYDRNSYILSQPQY